MAHFLKKLTEQDLEENIDKQHSLFLNLSKTIQIRTDTEKEDTYETNSNLNATLTLGAQPNDAITHNICLLRLN